MTKAARIIRQSQGSEDSTSIKQQLNETEALADDLGVDELETINLGKHTGFSIHYKDEDEERIDNNEEIQDLLERLRAGEFDYLLAYDDTRICRDQFYWTVSRACEIGECGIEFVAEVPDDPLTFSVKRAVSASQKHQEIQRSKKAVEERLEDGSYHGRPPFGLQFGPENKRLEPDPEEYEIAVDIIERHESGESMRSIAGDDDVPVSRSTVSRITDNKEQYLTAAHSP